MEKTIITIEIDDHTVVQQKARIVARRGKVAVLGAVQFTSSVQLAEAIVSTAQRLGAQEFDAAAEQPKQAKPAKPPAAKTKKTPAKKTPAKPQSIEDAKAPVIRESRL